jgi:hypothetical protein
LWTNVDQLKAQPNPLGLCKKDTEFANPVSMLDPRVANTNLSCH